MRARSIVAAGVVLAMAGCSEPDAPKDLALPSPGYSYPSSPRPEPSRSVPPPAHQWRTNDLTCPTVTAAEARAVGVAGPGTLTSATDVTRIGQVIDCTWKPADGPAQSVTVKISTSTRQDVADQGWQRRTAGMTEQVEGVGEQAFIQTRGNLIIVEVRSGNANLNMLIAGRARDPEGVAKLQQAAPFLAGDMLSSLVPA